MKLCRECSGNNAGLVNGCRSSWMERERNVRAYYPCHSDDLDRAPRSLTLTPAPHMLIIIFTHRPSWNRATYGQASTPRSQVSGPPPTGLFPSPRRAGHRRPVCDPRVFRSPRPRAGQIRDAAPRAERGTRRWPLGGGGRLLASLVLSSTGRVSAGRTAGADPAEAWAEKRPQAHRRCPRVCPSGTSGRFVPASSGSGCTRQGPIRHHRPSTQHRARLDAPSKKTAVNEPLPPSVLGQDFVVRYEQLRQDALNGSPRVRGVGFTLFLRHGTTEWMRACSCAAPPMPEAAPAIVMSPWSCDVRTQAASILAGILLSYRSETT